MASSSQTNQFEILLATQRHAEIMTYLKQFSRAFSESNNTQTVAIADCIEQLQNVLKSVAGFSTDARRLESSNREQLTNLEREMLTIQEKISDINRLLMEKRVNTNCAKKNGDFASIDSTADDGPSLTMFHATEDGICVADYLLEVQQRRLRSTGISIPAGYSDNQQFTIEASVPNIYESNGTEIFDDLFGEQLSTLCASSIKNSEKRDKQQGKKQSRKSCSKSQHEEFLGKSKLSEEVITENSRQERGLSISSSVRNQQSINTPGTGVTVAVTRSKLRGGDSKMAKWGDGKNCTVAKIDLSHRNMWTSQTNIRDAQEEREEQKTRSSSEAKNDMFTHRYCLNGRNNYPAEREHPIRSRDAQNLEMRSDKRHDSQGFLCSSRTLKRKGSSDDVCEYMNRDSYMTQPINLDY